MNSLFDAPSAVLPCLRFPAAALLVAAVLLVTPQHAFDQHFRRADSNCDLTLDISDAVSKGIDSIPIDRVDTVITLCAEEVCPVLPGDVRRLHWPIPDPAAATGNEEERREAFRNARDEIRRRLVALLTED